MTIKENLDRLVGTWNTTGVVVDGGKNDGVTINGTDRYEWLGELFLVHYADVTFGESVQRTIEIFTVEEDGFSMTAYNQDGSVEKMSGTFDQDDVYRAGDNNVRTTLTIQPDNLTMKADWEMNVNGEWKHWLKMSFTK